mmetsp:Transcript_148090/g.258349  ORF Transcript_148090/g.258349 Transcript_148090/m.258349 type:complete len:212 (-) Transcript_148090:175-810(-)
MSGSASGRNGSQAVTQGSAEGRLKALEEQHGLEQSSGTRQLAPEPSSATSTLKKKRRSSSGTPQRTPAKEHPPSNRSQPLLAQSASLPQITEIKRSELTRRLGSRRTPTGGFMGDPPKWEASAPVLPSKHRFLSKSLWLSLNPAYDVYPEETEHKGRLVDHKIKGPPLKAFMMPRDKFVKYREELFTVGNQQIMRKGGSTMNEAQKRREGR